MQNNLKLDIRITEDQQIFIKDFLEYYDNQKLRDYRQYEKLERNKDIFLKLLLKEKTNRELADEYNLSITTIRQVFKVILYQLNFYKRQRFFNYDNNDYISNKFNITSRYTEEVSTEREITL
jgi:DNA-binding NarL/FixJ family response regulator